MDTIKIEQKEKWWIATYTTLDIVAQGETKDASIYNLLECITIQIDFAIEHDNLKNMMRRVAGRSESWQIETQKTNKQ